MTSPSMKSLHVEQPPGAWETFPMRLGFKHEYYGDKIHQTPLHHSVVLRLALPASAPEDSTFTVRPPSRADLEALERLFRLAFRKVVYYADYRSRQDFQEAARDTVAKFFAERVKIRQHARVALDRQHLVGAALLEASRLGPMLSPIFTRPTRWRRGIATLLLNHVASSLHAAGHTHLHSQCHLANHASLHWHQQAGFEELPDVSAARLRARFYQHELQRQEKADTLSAAALEQLRNEAQRWAAEADRLSELERKDRRSVHPLAQLFGL